MCISMKRAADTGALSILFLFTFALACLPSTAAEAANQPPTISGVPSTTVTVGSRYNFRPTASDPDDRKKTLRFSVANKPAWASFSDSSGRLSGVPKAVGTWSDIRITVTDGQASASLPAFAITATKSGSDGGSTNSPPTISGSPPTSVTAGETYSFRPTASDPDGNVLSFSVTNRPSWASFSTVNGTLSGTPAAADVGTYSNIVITVSDGMASASLSTFAITVSDVAGGSATLSWTPPTRNTDGSTLTDLAGYLISYGSSASDLSHTVEVSNPGIATYVVENLSPGTWYFSVRAYSSSGVQSAPSNVASKLME